MTWKTRCDDVMGVVNNLAEVVQQQDGCDTTVEVRTCQHVAQGVQNSNAVTYKRFMELDPPAFMGKRDPETAESWLREIKRIFCVFDVPEEKKVSFWYLSFERPR